MKFNIKEFVKQMPTKIMKITIKELLESNEGFMALKKLDKIPTLTAYKIAKLDKVIRYELEVFTDFKNAKIKELGEEILDADKKPTGNWNVKQENTEAYQEAIKKLLAVEVEIEVPEVKLADLGVATIAPETITPLLWLIKE